MNFVVDENVSSRLVHLLRHVGHTVHSMAEIEDRGLSDDEVRQRVKSLREGILITRDYHFTNPTRFNPAEVGAVIDIRQGNLHADEETELTEHFLQHHDYSIYQGRPVTLSRHSVRLR